MNIEPIATIYTPFSEKFTIPRQAGIVKEAVGRIDFAEEYRQKETLNGLTAHSHYWLVWGIHMHIEKKKTLTVRPPRLGGNKRVGVFATRSPLRPNNLGLSVVKLESVDSKNFALSVGGVDMLDGTPIYDIKPYIPYADSLTHAESEWASDSPTPDFRVIYTVEVEKILVDYDKEHGTKLLALISALLAYDSRPAYKSALPFDEKTYATTLYDVDVAWQILGDCVMVISAKKLGLP